MVLVLDRPPHGSTFQDRTHKGPGQAGNKSALAWRTDIGIPGYTGFIPSWASQPLFPKGATLMTAQRRPETRYAADYTDPGELPPLAAPAAMTPAATTCDLAAGTADMLLLTLDQYSRGRIPHYTGHRPQAACNIRLH
ncbi:hypothetical protein WJX81_003607 [Elliptochloris bilobata]|uniref:Uncharacterized protein n=1 Tax=Elliptochloris bilobata TaxID=381761 RepID=A0AAW1RE67_9CHLO